LITGVGHLQMTVGDIPACQEVYGAEFGLEEIASAKGADGCPVVLLAAGTSVLELREGSDAVNAFLPSGEKKDHLDVPGSVGHFAFYVEDNDAQPSSR